MVKNISREEFVKGELIEKKPAFKIQMLGKIGNKIMDLESVHKLMGKELKTDKIKYALYELQKEGKIEKRLVNGIVYYGKKEGN